MINHEEPLERVVPPQTDTGQGSARVSSAEESMLKPAGDLPPQTETRSAPSGDQKQGQSSLRQPADPKPSQSGRSRPARRNVPRAVVTIDDRPTVETDADKTRSDLLDLVESQKSGRILTGTIQGIEQLPSNPDHSVAVIYYGDFKVVIPVEEAVELPANFSGTNGDTVRQLMLSKRLGAEVDYIVKGLDQDAGVAVASRLEAMRAKRRQYYLGTDRDGNYRICEGICAEARVVSSIRAGIFVDLFGLEVFIPIRELSYQRLLDASTQFQPGQRILVKILRVDRTDRDHLKVSASVKQAGANPYERALQKYTVGNKYVGSVSMVDATGVFVALDGGIDCLCSYPKRGRPPRGARVTVRILGINRETNRIWGAITHVALAR